MILEMIGIGWILATIQETEAILSKGDINMPACDEETWRHSCQQRKFFEDYACTKDKFGPGWKKSLPHTNALFTDLTLRQKLLKERSSEITDNNLGDLIIGATISEPLKFWSRLVQNEVNQNEIPENYLGELAMDYLHPDFIKIVSSFFPIHDLSAQNGFITKESVTYSNASGCFPEQDLFLLQNKEVFLNNYEEDSTKQAQVEYEALMKFIYNLGESLKKQKENLIYFKTGDYPPYSPETTAKVHILFMEQLVGYNLEIIDRKLTDLKKKLEELELQVNKEEEGGSGLNSEECKGERGAPGMRGIRGPRGFTGPRGEKAKISNEQVEDITGRILDSDQLERIVEKIKKDKLSTMIQELFNSTVNEMVAGTIGGKVNVEMVVIASVTFSISLSILVAIHTCCIIGIWRRNRSIDLRRAVRRKRETKVTKPRLKK